MLVPTVFGGGVVVVVSTMAGVAGVPTVVEVIGATVEAGGPTTGGASGATGATGAATVFEVVGAAVPTLLAMVDAVRDFTVTESVEAAKIVEVVETLSALPRVELFGVSKINSSRGLATNARLSSIVVAGVVGEEAAIERDLTECTARRILTEYSVFTPRVADKDRTYWPFLGAVNDIRLVERQWVFVLASTRPSEVRAVSEITPGRSHVSWTETTPTSVLK